MSYSDILNAVNLGYAESVGSLGNKGNQLSNIDDNTIYGRRQPYRGPNTFMGSSSRNIYGNEVPEVYDPRSMFQDEEGNWAKHGFLTNATKGLTGYQMGSQISPYLQNFATSLGGTNLGAGGLSLGPAMALRGYTNDMNPYTYTGKESMGNTASNMMMAHQASKLLPATSRFAGGTALTLGSTAAATALPVGISAAPAASALIGPSVAPTAAAGVAGVNPYVMLAALAFSMFQNKKRKRKAAQLEKKAIEDVRVAQYEGYQDRAKQVGEARDKYLADVSQQQWEREAGRYSNQYGGAYNTPSNYAYGDEGMKFSPKELNKIAKAGRNGDTTLAHVNPQEAALLKSLGGSGTKNPYTNLPEYGYGSFVNAIGGALTGGASAVSNVINPIVSPIVNPIVDSLNTVTSPISGGLNNLLSTALGSPGGGGIFGTAGNVGSGAWNAIQNSLQGVSDVGQNIGENVVFPVLDPLAEGVHNVMDPIMEGIRDVAVEPVMGGITDISKGIIDASGAGLRGIPEVIGGGLDLLRPFLFPGSGAPQSGLNLPPSLPEKRQALEKTPDVHPLEALKLKGTQTSGMDEQEIAKLYAEGFRGDLDNPLIRENVLELAQGGKVNTVAEFTGNELIVNDQTTVEKGISTGNYKMAAAPIRKALKRGYVTPGIETHQGNPLPVDDKGNIYAGGGTLPFKVNKGAGVYDHATDQFKSTMTDKEIAMVAQNNINKWESNGMA